MQRLPLRLRQSPGSTDIEPLVGSVTTQGLEMFEAFQVPQDDDAIVTATGQGRSVWAPRTLTNRRWLAMTDPLTHSCGHFPHLYLSLIASTGQKPAIWTPRHAEEGGVEVIGIAQGLHSSMGRCFPHLYGIVQPAARQEMPIRTPRDSIRYPTMAAQEPGRRPAITLPNGHQGIGACAGKPGAISVPGHIVECHGVALDHTQTLPALHIPHAYGAIFTSTEQAPAIWQESKRMDHGRMPAERHAIAAPFGLPEPDCLVTAPTGQRPPIRAPGHRIDRSRVSCKRLTYLETFHVPQLDGSIKAPARQAASIGGEGHRPHRAAVSREATSGSVRGR